MIFLFFSSSIGHLEPDLEQFENQLIFDGLPKFPAATASRIWNIQILISQSFFYAGPGYKTDWLILDHGHTHKV